MMRLAEQKPNAGTLLLPELLACFAPLACMT
jgi:hypothetical protein